MTAAGSTGFNDTRKFRTTRTPNSSSSNRSCFRPGPCDSFLGLNFPLEKLRTHLPVFRVIQVPVGFLALGLFTTDMSTWKFLVGYGPLIGDDCSIIHSWYCDRFFQGRGLGSWLRTKATSVVQVAQFPKFSWRHVSTQTAKWHICDTWCQWYNVSANVSANAAK